MIELGMLNPEELDEKPLACIVHLSEQAPTVFHQVTIRKDKVSPAGYIRLGETQGDEAAGWRDPDDIEVCEILGVVNLETNEVTPL